MLASFAVSYEGISTLDRSLYHSKSSLSTRESEQFSGHLRTKCFSKANAPTCAVSLRQQTSAKSLGTHSFAVRSVTLLLGRGTAFLQRRAGNHQPLDLGRALVDLSDAGVPVEALHRKVAQIAVAAVDLHR
jgi:hypothetical protein